MRGVQYDSLFYRLIKFYQRFTIEVELKNKSPEIPLKYYFKWQGIEDFSEYFFDKNGIPRYKYRAPIGLQYNAITTAQYGLCCLAKWIDEKDDIFLDKAFAAGEWLMRNAELLKHNAVGWIYRFDLDFYGPKAPWISAMAQGEAISLLLRLNIVKQNDAYVETARKASTVFQYDIKDGGVRAVFPDGSPVFEEFPAQPPPHVLNGHIFSLLGLYDFAIVTNDAAAQQIFREAVEGLKKNIYRYDLGWWTYYDLHATRRLASRVYQEVHVRLLRILAQIIPDPFYDDLAAQWAEYLASPLCRSRWFLRKLMEKAKLVSYTSKQKS